MNRRVHAAKPQYIMTKSFIRNPNFQEIRIGLVMKTRKHLLTCLQIMKAIHILNILYNIKIRKNKGTKEVITIPFWLLCCM
jgi:hypothetical protein